MWNRKNRTPERRHPGDAELEGIIRRGLGGEETPPSPKRVVVREEKRGFDPYDSRGTPARKPGRSAVHRGESGGADPYNTADRGAGKHLRWWD